MTSVKQILEKSVAGERLSPAEGLALLESHDLVSIGEAANAVSKRMHPEPYRTYNIDRNINYTNVCSAVCDFCAFYRKPKSPEGYVLDRQVIFQKVEETVALGGDQILMQGGMNPDLPLEWYEDLLRSIKQRFDIDISERHVGRLLKQLKFTRLSVRPRHPEADEAAQEAFKKTLPNW